MKTKAITFDQLVSGVLLYQGNTNTHMFNDVFRAMNNVNSSSELQILSRAFGLRFLLEMNKPYNKTLTNNLPTYLGRF